MTADRYVLHPPRPGPMQDTLLVLWHGAGGDIEQPHLTDLATAVAARGAHVARARFDYRIQGKRMPDRMPKLIVHARETIRQIREEAGATDARLVLGGRSMGGRVASMIAAEGDPVDGLIFLSYPLHPAKKKDKLRDAHLYEVACPMLFVQGDRDALADMTLLRPVLERLGSRATLAEFPGADHSLRKVTPQQVVDVTVGWLDTL